MPRERLDQLLVQRGLAASGEQARRLIRAGQVRVQAQPADKPGRLYDPMVGIEVLAGERYVSRGGHKLEAALTHWQPPVAGAICLDVGASTGGFTDCLLQHGAAQVIAVDVGQGQLDWRLRQDARVTVIERLNARYLKEADLPARPSLAVIDVSFISLTLILPPVSAVLEPGGVLITLIKPQFEAGRDQVERGGVVRDPAVRQAVADRIRAFGEGQLGLAWRGLIESPLPGPAGNREWLAYWSKQGAMGTVPA